MSADYTVKLVLLGALCQIVPTVMAISPAAMTRSRACRLAVHLGSIALGIWGLIFLRQNPLQLSVVMLSVMTCTEYWVFVVLEQNFEKKYGREPKVSGLVRRYDMNWEDRWMSLACFVLSIGAMFLVIVVGRSLS